MGAPEAVLVEFAQFINDATINHSTDAVNLRAYKLLIIQFHSILSRPQFRQEAHPYLIYLTPIRDALRHDWDLLREKHQADLINILSATILNLIAVKNEGLTALGRIQGTYELLQKDGYFNLNRTHRHIDYRTDASINMINELLVELNQEVSKDEENNILQQLWQMDILASIGEILQYTHPRFKGITEAQMNTFIDCGNTTYHRAEENALKLVAALSEIPALQESISTQSKFHKKIK